MSAYVDAEFQFDFGLHAATLEAEPRTRLAAAVNVARSWCGFEVAIVTGHADSSEGASSRSLIDLSVARAAYVGKLLEELGMPRKRIYEEGKGAGQPHLPWSGRVEVYLKGEGTGGRGCNIPPDTRGFRVRD
jgi:flagellar motor protein MotB